MNESKDFVIDTGMPFTESQSTEQQTVESASIVEVVPINEEFANTQIISDAQEPEIIESIEEKSLKSSLDEDRSSLAYIVALIENLQNKFDEKIAVDEHKNRLFDKLYKERDEYKNDIYGKLLKPFITGCIEIINDLKMYISKMDNYEVERSLNYLKTLPDDIVELLENNGVELYSEESNTFNPRTQRAKKIVPTEDVALNNTIAEHMEKGYAWNGVVLRPEIVAVYRTK